MYLPRNGRSPGKTRLTYFQSLYTLFTSFTYIGQFWSFSMNEIPTSLLSIEISKTKVLSPCFDKDSTLVIGVTIFNIFNSLGYIWNLLKQQPSDRVYEVHLQTGRLNNWETLAVSSTLQCDTEIKCPIIWRHHSPQWHRHIIDDWSLGITAVYSILLVITMCQIWSRY